MKILFVSLTPPMDRSYGAALRANNVWRSLQSLGEVDTLVLTAGDETKYLPADKEYEFARIQFLKPMLPWSTPRSRAIQALLRLVGYCPEQYVGPWQNRKGVEATGFVDNLAN